MMDLSAKEYGVHSLIKYWWCHLVGHSLANDGDAIYHDACADYGPTIEQDSHCRRCGMMGTTVTLHE